MNYHKMAIPVILIALKLLPYIKTWRKHSAVKNQYFDRPNPYIKTLEISLQHENLYQIRVVFN